MPLHPPFAWVLPEGGGRTGNSNPNVGLLHGAPKGVPVSEGGLRADASGQRVKSDEPALDAWELFERVVEGRFDEQVRAWLQRGFAACARSLRDGQDLPLSRCLRLGTSKGRSKRVRNRLLTVVASLLGHRTGDASVRVVLDVHRAIEHFATRGAWRLWQQRGAPPDSVTELEMVLFQILVVSEGRVLGLKQVGRVLEEAALDKTGCGNVQGTA